MADATTTGVFEPVTRPVLLTDNTSLSDTSQVPAIDTGQVAAVNLRTPRILKVLVGLVAFLIVVGAVALLEHDNVNHWYARRTVDDRPLVRQCQSCGRHHVHAQGPFLRHRDHNPHLVEAELENSLRQGRPRPIGSGGHVQCLGNVIHREDPGGQRPVLGAGH